MFLRLSMPTSLKAHENKLSIQLKILTSGFNRHLTVAQSQRLVDKVAIREGFISSLWQAWCRFNRSVILTSAAGGFTGTGVPITCTYMGLTEADILYVAKQLSNGATVGTIRSLAGPHLEPTWGDVGKVMAISGGMGLSNGAQLLSALSIATSVQDLQTCRNASAHIGLAQLARLKAARVRYVDTKIRHPTDAAVWIDPGTSGYLWDSWVDEISLIASHACA
jgi:hypothetical protein